MKTEDLTLQVNEDHVDKTTKLVAPTGCRIDICPPVGEGYWLFRVVVGKLRNGKEQAVVGFRKFTTIGVGFEIEEDWNTNLPYRCDTQEIWQHIDHNKGNDDIPDERCIGAIRLVQQAAAQLQSGEGRR